MCPPVKLLLELGCLHCISVPGGKSHLHSQFSFLSKSILEMQQMMMHMPASMPPMWMGAIRVELFPGFRLTHPYCCGFWGDKPEDTGSISYSSFQMNKLFKKYYARTRISSCIREH